MSDTPVGICSYASMDIEARPSQCASTMIVDTQAGFRMTFTVVFMCWKNARISLIVSLMRCYSLNNRPRSIYQYSSMAPRLSGQTSIFGVVFFVSKSLLGIERQKKL